MSKTAEVSDLYSYLNALYTADVLSKEQWSRLSEKVNAVIGPQQGPIVITKVQQVCFGAPSSWAAWTAEGKEYSLRYRYGVGLLKSFEDDRGEMIARFEYGDSYAGICTLEEFVERLGGYIELSEDLQRI